MTVTAPAVDVTAAREFVDRHVIGEADAWDRQERIPEAVLDAVSAAGMWAPFLSPEVGGSGLSWRAFGQLHEEFGRGCSSLRSLLTVHSMAAWTVMRWGSSALQAEWLPRFATGEALGAVCMTEPQAGSDTAGFDTRATRSADGWRLSGVKTWITGALRADVFLVYARNRHGLAAYLVPRDSAGLSVEPVPDPLGTRASMIGTVRLDDVRVAPDALVGPESFLSGAVLTGMLDIGRLSVAAGSLGILQGCLDACATYTTERTVGGTRLRDLQLIRAKVSDMVTDAAAARLLVTQAAELKDAGDPETIMATWIAKYFASVAAARHAREAVQVHGAHGMSSRFPVARLYRDAKVMEIIEGSTELQQLTIADSAYQR
ncbi:acyl-CoA dehydrogenase family protein [Micromonospora sp. NPDC049044]|uniref:acyl-CoA dehydrogenase family protein n=1 Tax=unclassified Micromonospora TaxID=2617518 RepID=UPI0033EE2FB6